MTFIASVIAKSGVALIADSLITTSKYVIELEEFADFLSKKFKTANSDQVLLEPKELWELFHSKTSHTKDYEEKLFRYDNYSALLTAGSAVINSKKIDQLINEIVEKNRKNKGYKKHKISTKVSNFCKFIEKEAKNAVRKEKKISTTKFIFTFYDNRTNKPSIYKIALNECKKEDLKNPDFKLVTQIKAYDFEKVVCDGQNRISEKILFGNLVSLGAYLPKIVNQVLNDFSIVAPADYLQKFSSSDNIKSIVFDDIKIDKLSELSLQQAVELANLLMKIEMDFQKYTEMIPTVGGVIKIAVIDKKGFRFVVGDDITRP